jgi:YbbR domain-containing protein
MPLLRNWVLHNWHLKLFALLAAFLLWSTYTSEPAAEFGFAVPLEIRNVPSNMEISGDIPSQVRLRVRGRSSLLRRLSAADLGITVDLAGAKPGEMRIELTPDMVETPYGATVVRIAPAEFHLTLVTRN